MKKLLSLVLICAMGFGMISCVESEESPSVEAIRNAKAEQLKALAAYYNAEAQAKLIIAQAEAAYKAAQAAYEQALADQVNNDIEQAKAKFAYEIEYLVNVLLSPLPRGGGGSVVSQRDPCLRAFRRARLDAVGAE